MIRLQKLASILVSFSMLLQLFALPFTPAGTNTALAAPAGPLATPFLPNIPTPVAPQTTEPDVLAQPLTIARAQSTYQATGTAVVTYTLRNTLPPTIRPAAEPGATITDTVAAISATDFAADPNNLRGTQLTLQLTNAQTQFLAASQPADQNGSNLTFNLGDIPPLSAASLVLTLTIPSSAADFVDLDAGAAAYSSWRGVGITTATSPIRLAPDGFAQWLVCTPDANCNDSYVNRKAAELGHDPLAIFEFVRSLGYESYQGSLRGARGTLWSEAGNGIDQASLLIALLRASGVPAAYRLGTLNQANAQTLITSMFPAVTAPSGLILPGTSTADPANDPQLLAEAQSHAWVEAYLPGSSWTALDPAFPAAQPGNVFGTPSGGQIAELPDNLRHKVSASLVVEKYAAFPVNGTNLYTINPLNATFNTVELAGEPLVFAHLVESNFQGGLTFTSAQHTYTPYFVFGEAETLYEGEPFIELISNFPFGQDMVVAEWLDFTLSGPGRVDETYRRELFDDIGFAARAGGGLVGELNRDETARLSLMSSWTTLVAAYHVPPEAINDAYQEMVTLSLQGIAAREAVADLQDTDNPTPEQTAIAQAAVLTFGKVARLGQRLHLLQFAAASDQAHGYAADAFLVKAYADSPRLFTVGWERNDQEQTESITFDLLRNKVRAVTYPGQSEIGSEAFLFWRALLDMGVEHEVLAQISPAPLVSVGAVFDAAIAADIPLDRFTYGTLDELAALPISDQAKARIAAALTENPNQYVIVPVQMITLPGATEPTIGWLQIDNDTLEVIDTMENGQHFVAGDYAVLAEFSKKAGSLIGGFTAGFFSHTMGFWIGFFGQMPLDGQDIGAVIAASKASAAAWGHRAEKACVKKSDKKWCARGVTYGNALGAAIIGQADPPLQETLFVLPLDQPQTTAQAAITLTQPATLIGQTVAANVATGAVGLSGTATHDWTTTGQNNFTFDNLSVNSASLYQNGLLVGSGAVTAVPATTGSPASAQATSGVTVSGTANGRLVLHAPAVANLGGGSQFNSFDFALDAAGNYTLALQGATATLNGTPYSGDLEIVTNAPAQLTGTGATAVPNFATTAAFTPAGGGFTIAAATGTLTVGGSAVSPANGFALGNVNSQGTVTPAGNSDNFSFNGIADFFRVSLSSATSTTPAGTSTNFTAAIDANFSDTYTLTVHAPAGWDVTISPAGQITAQPPIGAAADDYTLIVSAQSATHPDLFATARHVVTVTAVDGVSVSVAPDPTLTIPWGPDYNVLNFNPTIGRLQIPDAAFTASIQNSSSVGRTFNVNVSGLPGGWAIFGGQPGSTSLSLPLAAGQTVRLGLYISPTLSLPPVGSTYPFDITATADDNGAVTATGSGLFTMPAIPYPAVAVSPAERYVAANSSTAISLTLTNIGNTTADFDLLSTLPAAGWTVSTLQSPLSLAPGASATQPVTITVTTGDPGVDYPVGFGAVAPTLPYTPTTAIDLYVVSPFTEPIFRAATCNLDSDVLAGAIIGLAVAVDELAASCTAGSCNLALRDAVVAAAQGVVTYAEAASPLVTTGATVEAAANDLATQTDDAAIEASLATLATAASNLGAELCEIEQHGVSARFTPYLDAILLGGAANFSLDVTNQGSITTTYAITITGLPGGDLTFNEAITPGATVNLPVTPTPAGLGTYDLTATIVPIAPDVTANLAASATARLNVVDRFVQVTQVAANPPFVDTGTSATDLSVTIANVANVARPGTAHTTILAPGGAISYTADLPLTVLVGAPRTYPLATVDTSGWASGVYTVAVELRDAGNNLIPDGSGYGYFAVGQSLGASQAVLPAIVAPGTVTVTTYLTTEILADTLVPPAAPAGALWPATGLRSIPTSDLSRPLGDNPPPADNGGAQEVIIPTRPFTNTNPAGDGPAGVETITGTIILRYEQDEAALTGTWQNIGYAQASNGTYLRADAPGETAQFTFTGTWVHLGFLADSNSGYAEILIDGLSQGLVDLYRRDITPISFVYDGLSAGSHTLSVVAQGAANPLSLNDFVHLDYLDVYNGGSYADGTSEQSDSRIFRSTGWTNVNDANASGGSYMRSNNATAWFPFTGDSITYQALAYSGGGKVKVYIDGLYQTTLNLYNPLTSITRTLSFEGLGAGPHVMQVSVYRGSATVDAFRTPGTPPFFTEPTPGSFARYEEEYADFLFNGLPYTATARTWARDDSVLYSEAGDGQVIYSRTAGDTASLTFDGTWASIGFFTKANSGQAEIFLDGASQGVVDLYSNEDDVTSLTFAGLLTGTHTISVTVLGTANPLASNQYVYLDYVDVWDGSPLPDGTFEELSDRVLRSGGWEAVANASASGGVYIETGSGEPTVWFPFMGDSVTYQAFDYFRSDEVSIYIDEVFLGRYDIYTGVAPTITYSFDDLGPGLHILKIRDYRNEPTLDAFISPAISAPTPPPPAQVFTRVEEDDAAVRYNGLPYPVAASTWDRTDEVFRASDGQYIITTTPGDWVSLDFDGTWVTAGFATNFRGGQAEVFIDGVSQGIVELYSRDDDVTVVTFNNLPDTTHTISATLLTSQHPNSLGRWMMVDYFDVWSGDPLPGGTYEETHPLVYRSDDYDDWDVFSEAAASGGSYIRSAFQHDGTVWFPFTGDSVTFLGLANNRSDRVAISIDGISYGTFNLYSGTPVTRPISFDGLGTGPHLMQVRLNRDYLAADAFIVPGIAPFYEPPAYTGIVRYEEDDPALLYNGAYDWRTRPQSWYVNKNYTTVSGGWHVESNTAGNTVSLTFDGRWASVGFRVRNVTSQAEIFIDGASQGVFDLNNATEDVRSYQFPNLITGTHTISVSVVAGTVYFDYFDAWDGQPTSDALINTRRGEDNSHLHYTSNLEDAANANAIGGDVLVPSLWYADSNVWFSFVGDAFTLYGFTYIYDSLVDVYIDGVLVDTPQFKYPYTEQPRAHHYTGLEPGPHVVRVSNVNSLRVDAFQANPAQPVPYLPLAEWWDNTPAGNGAPFFGTFGIAAGMTAGDLDGDGSVEIIVSGDDVINFGTLFVFRGDGGDTGDGDPILWSHNFGGGVYRTWVSSPALAELDGQPGAEVVVAAGDELWAFHADGSTYWNVPTANIFETLSAPAIGNLDLDPEPEIVANLGGTVEVREHDGTLAWSTAVPPYANPPVLADLTGDGLLDLILTGWDDDVWVYDYNDGTPQLVWTAVLTSSMAGTFGAPAVADIDGDGSPEVMVSHYGALTAFNGEDGSVLWTTPLDPGNPGGVSVADLDGDGEINILTGMRYEFETNRFGMIYALNPDGSLLWSAIAEDSSSANNASVLDLNGDGAYEVAWNGKEQGFTIYNGADGTILFNEPLANSATGTDYPLFVDVDGDSNAEVVVPTIRGLVVFGQDGVWGEARPLWNQHSYHITNVNDDLTVPFSEANSWQVHNTYRTQTNLVNPLPNFSVNLTHTVGISGVTVLTGTFSAPPTTAADPLYGWAYSQTWAETVAGRSFASQLSDLQPGETRLVAQGTEVVYTLPSGSSRLTLPPLYVSVPHIISVAPFSQTVGTGGTAVYDLLLSNPAGTSDTYTLTVAGLPASWISLPTSVNLAANSSLTLPLTITTPAGTNPASLDFAVDVQNQTGGTDQATANLTLINTLALSISPAGQETTAGTPLTYTLTISNNDSLARTYDLSASGLASVSLPPSVTVPAGSSQSLPIQVSAANSGPHPFTVRAAHSSAAAEASAVHSATGRWQVALALDANSSTGGPGTPAGYVLSVSNLGDTIDSYSLTVDLPAGWQYTLDANGSETDSVTLTPAPFNSAELQLLVTPPVGTAPGSYPFSATAQSQTRPGITTTVTATLELLNRGVQVTLDPAETTLDPTSGGTWQVTITNTGSIADSYVLTTTGILLNAEFATNPVTLNPGQATTVALSASQFAFALPQRYPFAVAAISQSDNRVANEAQGGVTFTPFQAVQVGWQPPAQTVSNTLSASLLMVITNTGNINTNYQFSLDMPGLSGQLPATALNIPAQQVVMLPLNVTAAAAGTYAIEGTASGSSASASAVASVTFDVAGQPPQANAGPDQTADEGELVQFSGSASDPDGGPLTILWTFGDGSSASGTLSPTHTYADNGQFTATLVVTDSSGLSSSDSLQVTVVNVGPTVNAGSNQNASEGQTVSLAPATFTDPGSADTHTATINWGDGTVEAGTVNQAANSVSGSHSYADNGLYTVTVTVTDDDGDSDSDSFTVTVSNVAPTVNAGSNQNAVEGDAVSLPPATFTDPGSADTHTALIDWGDGTVEPGTVNQAANTVSGSHTYADNDLYTVTVTVTDDDGDSGSDNFTVLVTNAAPVVNAGSNQNAVEGDTVSLAPATFTDPGSADTHTATINWGDGTVEAGTVNQAANTVSGSHTYADNGLYTVTVTVTDNDGGSGSDTLTVLVTNAAPVVNAGGNQAVAAQAQVCLAPATFTDAGSADTHTALIDWGDGTVTVGTVNQAAGTVSGCHTYAGGGSYTVTVTVTDDDGGVGSDSFTVDVDFAILMPIIVRP